MVKSKILRGVALLLAIVSFAVLVRVGHPSVGGGVSWAPLGLHSLATARGILALALALFALVLLILSRKPSRETAPALFFTEDEKVAIQAAISAAEARTSGEIRVHLERRTPGDILVAGQRIFGDIGMTQTAARNGVLIYLSVEDRRFALVGDEGIDRVVPDGFWGATRSTLESAFQAHRFAPGVIEAVSAVGEVLHQFFPREAGDRDELSNEVSFGSGESPDFR